MMIISNMAWLVVVVLHKKKNDHQRAPSAVLFHFRGASK
jgi:hypothetical protein